MSEKNAPRPMSENQQTAAASAALFVFAVLFAAGLWYADHKPSSYRPPAGAPGQGSPTQPARRITGGIVRWDTALTDKVAAPPRAPYALCYVWRGDRLTVTDTRTIDNGWTHYLALTADGCAGWIVGDALEEY